jgi:hypothetical protein
MSAVVRRFSRSLPQLDSWLERRDSAETKVVCPIDQWAFRPRYTDGRCPICGWEAPSSVVRLPFSRRMDAFGWMLIAFGVASVVMLILVSVAYTRS